MTDTERESMEAKARELWNSIEEEPYRGNDLGLILKALTEVGDERYREGMEEAAKVADWWGGLDGDGIAADIREKIKDV